MAYIVMPLYEVLVWAWNTAYSSGYCTSKRISQSWIKNGNQDDWKIGVPFI